MSSWWINNCTIRGIFTGAVLCITAHQKMEQPVYQLFVYGSLLSGFHHPAYAYISRYFTLIGKATVQGKLYDLGEYPGAVPCDESCFITGELYQVNNNDEFSWAIKQLDDYEGMLVERGEIPLFRREPVAILLDEQSTIAWIYWYNHEVTGKTLIETGDLLGYWKENK